MNDARSVRDERIVMFTVRRVLPSDRPALAAIAAQTWEGADYLPVVFDDWVADPDGEFAAVLLEGRVVGCGKMTFLTPSDVWFEGLRKDPSVREKGLAAAVSAHFLSQLAGRSDLASIRFSTYVKNTASIKANERLGFRKRVAFSWKSWTGTRADLDAVPLRSEEAARARVGPVTDEEAIFDFIESTGYAEAAAGLIPEGWRAYPFSRGLFASRYARRGLCRGVMEGGALLGFSVPVRDARFGHLYIKLAFLDAADPETANLLFDDVFLRARELAAGNVEIEWMVPPVGRVKEYCAARGFRSEEQEDDFLVFELPSARWEERGS